jgi:hypothetical protein
MPALFRAFHSAGFGSVRYLPTKLRKIAHAFGRTGNGTLPAMLTPPADLLATTTTNVVRANLLYSRNFTPFNLSSCALSEASG